MGDDGVEFVFISCMSMRVLVMSSCCIFSNNYANGSCGSIAVDLLLAIFFNAVLNSCVSSTLTNGSFICAFHIFGALLTCAFFSHLFGTKG